MADYGMADPWREGTVYAVNKIVVYEGKYYRCLTSHTAQATWNPKDAVTLWNDCLPGTTGGDDNLDQPYTADGGDPLDKPYTSDGDKATPGAGFGVPAGGNVDGGNADAPTDGDHHAPAVTAPVGVHTVSGGEWALGASYGVGDLCTYGGQTYQCRQAHTVYAEDWIPVNTPSLWLPVAGSAAPPPWQQGKTYRTDERCSYDGQNYTCRQAHTAHAANWTPRNTLDLWLPDN